MLKNHISVPVTLTEKQFKDFIIFDSMKKQRRWKTTVSITVILFTLATLCYASLESFPSLEMVGNILVMFSVLIPTNYFRSFYSSLKKETEKMNLNPPRHVYTINLSTSANGIHCFYPRESTAAGQFSWKNTEGAWRTKTAIYLYVTPQQALLIPNTTQSPDYETIWQFIKNNLQASQIHEEKH